MKLRTMLAALAMSTMASVAQGTVVYTFSASGVTENFAQQGTAQFSFADNGSSLSITLTNTLSPTAAILSELSGLSFILSEAPSTMTLTSVVAGQVVDCTNTSSPCPPGAGSSPYGWGSMLSGTSLAMGAGFDGVSFTGQPYGIVNTNYSSIPGGGQLDSAANNPLLVGPVTFTFSLTGLTFAPEVGNVVFMFGDPIPVAAAVPEPQSLALIAIGLIAAGLINRRRTAAALS